MNALSSGVQEQERCVKDKFVIEQKLQSKECWMIFGSNQSLESLMGWCLLKNMHGDDTFISL